MENLRILREQQGLSQQKLADLLDLTQQKIHGYETGAHEPDISTLKQIANFFETSVDFLIGNTDVCHKIEKLEPYELNEEESVYVDKLRLLTPKQRKSVRIFLDALIDR